MVLTGAAGFIGSHVAEDLLRDGHTVVGVDALTSNYDPSRKRSNLAQLSSWQEFSFEETDLVSADLEPLLSEADAVVHLAASPGVRRSWGSGFVTYSDANVLGLQRLLEALTATGVPRLVFASSSSIYGQRTESAVQRVVDLTPLSPYGVTKLTGELLCKAYQTRSPTLGVIALRYFTVYGPRQRPDMALSRFIDAALGGTRVEVYGDGTQRRHLTYVGDVARLTALAALHPMSGFHAFDVLGEESWSVNDMLDAVIDITGRGIAVDRVPGRSDDPLEIIGDGEDLEQAFGWRPSTRVQQGLQAQVAWASARATAEAGPARAVVETTDG